MNDVGLLMKPKQVQEYLGISSSKFYTLKEIDQFPKPRCLPGSNTPYYLRKEIEEWSNNLGIKADI